MVQITMDYVKDLPLESIGKVILIVVSFLIYNVFMIWFGHKLSMKSGKVVRLYEYDYRKKPEVKPVVSPAAQKLRDSVGTRIEKLLDPIRRTRGVKPAKKESELPIDTKVTLSQATQPPDVPVKPDKQSNKSMES
jgi:hypothetical protein